MRRILCAAALAALMSAGVVAGGVTAASAAPAPVYAATLTADAACAFTLTATWKNAKVDHVFGAWYLDGTTYPDNFLFTTEAPGTGPNGGVLRGRTATMKAGPATPDTASHTWHARVDYYAASGELLQQVWTSVSAPCRV